MMSNTIDWKVREILKECKASRYDDMILIVQYYNRYGRIPAGDLPLSVLAVHYKDYGLPCFESIRRTRQRVQSLYPEYGRKEKEIQIIIRINQKE